jgi:hypothetical protein
MQLSPSARAQFHERLIDRDTREPCGKARVSAKCVDVQESPRERILTNLLSILAVPGDLLREPENARAVYCHDLFESFRVASPCGFHERGVGFL